MSLRIAPSMIDLAVENTATTPGISREWPTTNHKQIDLLKHGTCEEQLVAEAYFAGKYRQPIFTTIRHSWRELSLEAVEDFTHDFICKKMMGPGNVMRNYQRPHRLRTFLRKVLQNFLVSRYRKENNFKGGGAAEMVPFSDELSNDAAELAFKQRIVTEFDRAWALTALSVGYAEVTRRLENVETREALLPWLLMLQDNEDMTVLAGKLGKTVDAARAALFRMRCIFREALQSYLRETMTEESELEDEMRELCIVLTTAPPAGQACQSH